MRKLLVLTIFLLVACSYVEKSELENGITLLVKPLSGMGLVSIDVLIHDGLVDESKPGIRNFIQSLLIKGTKSHNATELALILDELGSFSASAGEDYLELQFKVEKERLGEALDLLREFLLEATFPREEVEKERVLILEAIKAQEDNPVQLLKNGLFSQLYPNHAYRFSVLGSEESIKAISREDLLSYYQEHYATPRMTVSVVGEVDSEELTKEIRERTKGISQKSPEQKKQEGSAALIGKLGRREKEITDHWIGIAYAAPNVTSEDRVKMVLLNSVLGGSMGARLFTNLRDKQGLAYQVGSSYAPLEYKGHIILYIGTHPENAKKALKGLQLEAKNLSIEAPSQAEVEQALNKTLGNFLLNHESLMDQAAYLARYEALGLGFEYDEEFPKVLKKVTAADIQAMAQKYLKNGTAFIVGKK
ncbi:MAG TPA: pitrilysin family protein [Candidatus Nanoarchaeia archaeon]|nr:pitrilysin family protein [Candidatus Nanoarchaeia archaeon]